MPEETDDELATLQRKAYGRDGGVTQAEERRLRALEREPSHVSRPPQQAPLPVEELVDAVPVWSAGPVAVSVTPSADPKEPEAAVAADRADIIPRHTGFRELRSHWKAVAAASVLLLVIGVGAGWAIFAPRSDDIVLTGEQQQRRLELYDKGDYDDGSVRAIGQDDDALVWYATRNGGELTCMVLDVGETFDGECQEIDQTDQFMLSAHVVTDAEPGTVSGDSVDAYLLYSTTGEPLAVIQRSGRSSVNRTGFPADQRERAEQLFDDGFEYGLSIVGSFGDAPVWLADRIDGAAFETCVMIDAAEEMQCGSTTEVRERGLGVVVTDGTGAISGTWAVQVEWTNDDVPYLTIIGDVEITTIEVEDGARIELGGEHGDPIEVTVPSQPAG